MSKDYSNAIPRTVVNRLPKYLMHIQQLYKEGVQWISSKNIAGALGLTSSTVRQDLSHLQFSGISKRGYNIRELEGILLTTLGIGRIINTIIVGAGNLGRAVTLHNGYTEYGFKICGIFDNDPQIIGKTIGDHTIRDIRQLDSFAARQSIDIAILTVPFSAAQDAADKLVAIGIKGILNFTPAHILTDTGTKVIDNRILANLLELNCLIDNFNN